MSNTQPILVGDIGGTNARFALAHGTGSDIQIDRVEKFKGDAFERFGDALDAYFSGLDTRPKAASLAIAGPVSNGRVALTNRDWAFSNETLKTRFGFSQVHLINDFTAMARSVPIMDQDNFEIFYAGNQPPSPAPIVVAGPGTGFGMAILVPTGTGFTVVPGEGGHSAFAPQTAAECELMQILQKKYPFVSLELVSSGSGMDAVHEALCERHGVPYEKLPPHIIRERADAGDIICLEICEIRSAAVLGAVGDMALSCGALGGVVLAGGVSVRLSDFLSRPEALERFFNRGPRSDYMKDISIRLLTNDLAPLYGAAAAFYD